MPIIADRVRLREQCLPGPWLKKTDNTVKKSPLYLLGKPFFQVRSKLWSWGSSGSQHVGLSGDVISKRSFKRCKEEHDRLFVQRVLRAIK